MGNKFYILFLLFYFFSCGLKKYEKNPKSIFYYIYETMPDTIIKNMGYKFDFKCQVYDKENLVVFILPYHSTVQDDNKLISDTVKYNYFLRNKNEKNGYLYKEMNSYIKISNSDSFLNIHALGYSIKNRNLLKDIIIIDKKNCYKNNKLQNQFFLFDNKFYDSALFVYDERCKIINYSISSDFDSLSSSKLISATFYLKIKSEYKNFKPKDFFETKIEIGFDTTFNLKKLNEIIKRFKTIKNVQSN